MPFGNGAAVLPTQRRGGGGEFARQCCRSLVPAMIRRVAVTQADKAELLRRLERAMTKLPPTTRNIFLAHRLDGLSYQTIAERTGLSVGDVERHMSKALHRLCIEVDGERPEWWERLLRWWSA
jgi:RNA polymerase sigma-70 factor (ECF subfamily)